MKYGPEKDLSEPDLPFGFANELWLHILSLLDFTSLLKVREVFSPFRRLGTQALRTNRELHVKLNNTSDVILSNELHNKFSEANFYTLMFLSHIPDKTKIPYYLKVSALEKAAKSNNHYVIQSLINQGNTPITEIEDEDIGRAIVSGLKSSEMQISTLQLLLLQLKNPERIGIAICNAFSDLNPSSQDSQRTKNKILALQLLIPYIVDPINLHNVSVHWKGNEHLSPEITEMLHQKSLALLPHDTTSSQSTSTEGNTLHWSYSLKRQAENIVKTSNIDEKKSRQDNSP